MENILIDLLQSVFSQSSEYADVALSNLVQMMLKAEEFMKSMDISFFVTLYESFCMYGISLVVLKFLRRGFDMYVVWGEDPNNDPFALLTNFIKAMAILISFPTIYDWGVSIIDQMLNHILSQLTFVADANFWSNIWERIGSGGIFGAIGGVVFVIMYLVLFIQMMGRGIEMMILRFGFPIACTGLIDDNKGMFAPYVNKIIQVMAGCVAQIGITKLALIFMNKGHFLWGIASIFIAIKAPKFLSEFIATGSNGVNISMNNIYQASRMGQSIMRFAKR